jgi:hypothetical protein
LRLERQKPCFCPEREHRVVEQVLTPEHDASECRALVALGPASPRRRAAPRPAAFLAHLIAVKQQHPQTRERRRAEPAEALKAYRAALNVFRS